MRQCLLRKKIFSVKEDEYLNFVGNCSEDVLNKMKGCLLDDQQYLPDFFLNSTKSLISFLYGDIDLLRGKYLQLY